MRRRPRVELRIPSRVHPGDRLTVEVTLESAATTPYDLVQLDLVNEHFTGQRAGVPVERWRLRAELARNGELTPGTHVMRASFALPADTPPSYSGVLVGVRYRLELTVDIPWWRDVNERYVLPVLPRPVDRAPRRPVAATSLRGNEPFVEISLDDAAFAPGDVLTGSLAVGNVGRDQIRGVTLALAAFEEDRLHRAVPWESLRYTAKIDADDAGGGHEIPIRLAVPSAAATSFACAQCGLGWAFEVQVALRGAPDVVHRIPITLAPFDRPAAPGPMRRLIGAGRWSAVWAEVGRRHGLLLGDGDLSLAGSIAGCEVVVRTAVRDGRGELCADVRWEPLGLDLAIDPRRLLALPGVPIDDDAFADRLRARGRDAEQVRATLIEPLRRALLAFDHVAADDAHATVSSASPGHDQPWIGSFVDKVAALAAQIRAAAERVPPPAPLASALPAWRAFAEAHGGSLRVGSMSLFGAVIEGARFDVITTFTGAAPAAASVQLTVDPALPRGLDPHDPAALAAAPPSARAILAALTAKGDPLVIEPDRITLTLAAPIDDPAAARDSMAALSALAAALRGDRGAGPYR